MQSLFISPLIGMKEFRAMLLTELSNHKPAGKWGFHLSTPNGGIVTAGNSFWMVRLNNGQQVMAELNKRDPLSAKLADSGTFRVCDLYAWKLSFAEGLPEVELYWPEKKRDQAIVRCTEVLHRYGNEYEQTKDPHQ